MKIKEIIQPVEEFAPLVYQESYDNAGLIVGNYNDPAEAALLCIDITEDVIDEAVALGAGIIISHHPLIFGGLKALNGKNMVERCVIKAVKNNIALYACHTNIDSVYGGVSVRMAEKLSLKNISLLSSAKDTLYKIIVYVPHGHVEKVRNAMFTAGAGTIGNYDNCSFNVDGTGTFRAGENTNPYVGKKGVMHTENETRVETIFPKHLKGKVLSAMLAAHPYEEVAYDIYKLENSNGRIGMGAIGTLEEATDEKSFLQIVKKEFHCDVIRHTAFINKPVKKVAMCGGAGNFLLGVAKAAGADIFISGDFKYHDFFGAEGKIMIADIGHFESEQFTKDIFYELLTKKITNFAVHLSKINTNPVKYF